MRYPTDIVMDNGDWARIHQGHDLPADQLREDLIQHGGFAAQDARMSAEELHFGYAPRVKWCENYGGSCDSEGDWHSHWYPVKPNDRSAFTVVRWATAARQAAPSSAQSVQTEPGVVGSAGSGGEAL